VVMGRGTERQSGPKTGEVGVYQNEPAMRVTAQECNAVRGLAGAGEQLRSENEIRGALELVWVQNLNEGRVRDKCPLCDLVIGLVLKDRHSLTRVQRQL
jgi:predicted sugar kinase